eukprot:TRINITY_DN656_c0_g1_i1.p1 TRINITY_DN656_c0_g1~~TRINITY_DN656_c0_g1_i1.p1  ORF type:complete len:875 (+),score=192.53 TRINITY_DN656_c0_g1_i1:110-2626(+)
MMRLSILLLGLAAGAAAVSTASLPFKHLSGPPSEFPIHRVPRTKDSHVGENSFTRPLKLYKELQGSEKSVTYSLLVDSISSWGFSIFSPLVDKLSLSLVSPSGKQVDLSQYVHNASFSPVLSSTGNEEVPAPVYIFSNVSGIATNRPPSSHPQSRDPSTFPNLDDFKTVYERGEYKLTVSDPTGAAKAAARSWLSAAGVRKDHKEDTSGRLVLFNRGPLGIVSELSTYRMRVHSPVGVRVSIGFGNGPRAQAETAAPQDKVHEATLELTLPNGEVESLPMHDDGLEGDITAGDGEWHVQVTATFAGTYVARAEVSGTTTDGVAFKRSTQQMLAVGHDDISWDSSVVVVSHPAVGVVETAPARHVPAKVAALHADPAHAGPAVVAAADVVEVMIGVTGSMSPKYRVYAEVHDVNGGVAWVGGMCLPQEVTPSAAKIVANDAPKAAVAKVTVLSFFVDGALLKGTKGPYTLQQITAYDVDSNIPLTFDDEISLPPSFSAAAAVAARRATEAYAAATEALARLPHGDAVMQARKAPAGAWDSVHVRFGAPPAALFTGAFGSSVRGMTHPSREVVVAALGPRVAATVESVVRGNATLRGAAGDSGTALLHGYCAGENPFEQDKDLFTHNPHFFSDPGQSRSNDQFAQLVHEFMSASVSSYASVGHSQGGTVSTHLSNFYWSGVDRFTYEGLAAGVPARTLRTRVVGSRRPVQSIGTPYNGCTAAGSAADLGKVFSVGCGTNFDMSVDGAKLWITGISTAVKENVWYATTTYEQGNLLGDYCSMPMNLVLQWPNDGTSELKYTALVGGNSMGNTEKQCHTADMAYDAQYFDRTRNAEFNSHTV